MNVKRQIQVVASLALLLFLVCAALADDYTLESVAVSYASDVLADKSILVVGQTVAGTISNESYTIEVGQVPCLLASFRGDFDGDFDIDVDDVNAFVDVLVGVDSDPIHVIEADMNGDGAADGEDIEVFVAAMLTL